MKYTPDGLKELRDMGIRKGIVKGITREVSRWDTHRKSVEARRSIEALVARRSPARVDLSQDRSVDMDLTQDKVDEDDTATEDEDELGGSLENELGDERRRSQVTTTDESN